MTLATRFDMQRFVIALVIAALAGCGDSPAAQLTNLSDVDAVDGVDGLDGQADAVDALDAVDAVEEVDGPDGVADVDDADDAHDGVDGLDEVDGLEVDADVSAPPRDFGPAVPAALATSLQGVLDANFAAVGAAAVAIGVRLPDGSWWEGVSGEACYDPATTVAVGDRFRLGSITKTWVAAAVLQLVDEGRVDLDSAMGDYVPGFDLDPEVTVRRCLAHTTGIFDLTDDVLSIGADFSQPIAPGEIVRLALEHGPAFAPGTNYSYSNTNYFLLGLLLENVTGEPIAQVLRERMIEPLGLRDTFLEASEPATTTFVCGNIGDIDITHLLDLSWAWAAGAMVSSNGDLCRWADALWRGDVLPEALRAEMMTPTVLPNGTTVAYGLGTMFRTRSGVPVVGHNGQTLGFQSELFIDPVSGLCVSILANDFQAKPATLGLAAWALLVPALGLR